MVCALQYERDIVVEEIEWKVCVQCVWIVL
ncbi:hypothetical protein THOM_3165 [Trachipleistophora hominis]|uniref:Uncharacterized protein n=1 Tax=Trachipleistophora hominis TaxID=72359 RepID=L7JRK9_TRAHO|nr:hypothetical protein THOM_3165 [Trachipleistophora hominis]